MPHYPSTSTTTSIAEGVPISVAAFAVDARPVAAPSPREEPTTCPLDKAAAALKQQDSMWSSGLSATVAKSVAAHPLRVCILDNSGSMRAADGKRLVDTGPSSYKTVGCTRWQELCEDAVSLAKMSEALGCRTDFVLLNPVPSLNACSVCRSSWSGGLAPLGPSVDSASLERTLGRVSPNGSTPLTEAVMKVVSMVQPLAPSLRQSGQAIAVLICTDGLPNDQHGFVQAMRLLQTLPVWCVVRLVTDDDNVVSYWNDLDTALEAPLEVLDDLRGEAGEVCARNPWLTYAPPLHLARLFGLPEKLFDELDEQALLPSQIRQFLQMLLGSDLDLPEPELDIPTFLEAVRVALKDEAPALDPRSGKMRPWVDLRSLERSLNRSVRCNGKGASGEGGCTVM